MRNLLWSLLIIGVPAGVIIFFLLYGPQYYDQYIRTDSSLNKQFSTIVGDKIVVGSMDDLSALDNIKLDSSKGLSRSEQVRLANGTVVGDSYYHNINVEEIVNRQTEFYNLVANTPDELREQILKNAPVNSNTQKQSLNRMSYSVDWNLDTVQEEGECKLLGAKVVTTITLTMPRWIGIENMEPDAQKAWNEYLTSVDNYGNKHNKILDEISKNIANAIRLIHKRELCDDLISEVNDSGSKILINARGNLKRYQSETGGGRLMGVKLPVFADSDLATSEDINKLVDEANK